MHNKHRAVLITLSLFTIFLISLAFAQSEPAVNDTAKTGRVTGSFTVKGEGSMVGGQVAFYRAENVPPPIFYRYSRVPDVISEVFAEGQFNAELPSGEYYLVAIKRVSGEIFGPPRPGDLSYRLMHEDLSPKKFSIKAGEHIDFGTLEVIPGSREKAKIKGENSALKGHITFPDGTPVEKGIVFAYPTPQMQMHRPLFVSSQTGKDGTYSIKVAGDKEYYLMARGILGGGKLAVGEFIGVYGEKEPVGVFVHTGDTVEGINLNVFVVQPRGPREETAAAGKSDIPGSGFATGYLAGEAVTENGAPLSGAFVYLFDSDKQHPADMQSTDMGKSWWKLDQVVGQLDSQGKFNLEVAVGNYYLTIIKRSSGKVLEPLQEGDIYYRNHISAGVNKVITIKAGENTNLGRLQGHRYTKRGITDYPNAVAIASIYGTLTDTKREPVPGAYILVYSEPDRLGPPLFSAGPSKADGSYNILFYEEGTYYIVAKLSEDVVPEVKGVVRPKIMLGKYGGEIHQPLTIKKDEVKTGVDIVLQPVGPPVK